MRTIQALACLIPACALAAMAMAPTSRSATAPAGAAVEAEKVSELARTPISYFNQHCGSCHGDYGSFWGEGFAAHLKGEELREVVDEMAAGPAQAPLEEKELDVQTAYHRSLVDGKPFVVAAKSGDGNWGGEVTLGSTVTLIVPDGKETQAEVDGHTWASNISQASVVRVTKGEQTTEVKLEGRLVYSHAEATPE